MLEANTTRRQPHAVRVLMRAQDAYRQRAERRAARAALRRIARQYGTKGDCK